MFNPFLKNRENLVVYLLIWIVIAMFHWLGLYYLLQITLEDAIIDSAVYNILYAGIGISLWYPTRFISFDSYSMPRLLANHLMAAIITSIIWVFLGYYLLSNFLIKEKVYYEFISDSLAWRFVIGILFYAIIVSLNYVIIYYNNFREKELKESELNSLVKEAELKTLKYQINPHFIFNSLNSISSLTVSNPEKAREMTIKLSDFLRGTLSKNEKMKTNLSEELKTIKIYLDIEKTRFEDLFEYVEEVSTDCPPIEVPSMLLQPVFENAIKHGVYESIEKVTIRIKCIKDEDYLKITVENNFDPEAVPRKGEGIGLANIKNRLKLIYNQENLLTFSKENDIFRVTIFIPLPKKELKDE